MEEEERSKTIGKSLGTNEVRQLEEALDVSSIAKRHENELNERITQERSDIKQGSFGYRREPETKRARFASTGFC